MLTWSESPLALRDSSPERELWNLPMTDTDDPLLEHLRDEVDRIERLVNQRLPWPATATPGEVTQSAQTVRWSYRFTWQEVERGRRYVMPLPTDRAINARRSALEELRSLVADTPVAVQQADPRIRYRAGLNVYEISCSLLVDSQTLP